MYNDFTKLVVQNQICQAMIASSNHTGGKNLYSLPVFER